MNKISLLLIGLGSLLIGTKTNFVSAFAGKRTIVINSTDWMGALPRDLKLTQLNIPGAHDAGTAHTMATLFTENTVCQTYYIGNHTYYKKNLFSSNEYVTEPGLLEQGVRYLDIRYDTDNYNPEDESDVQERDNYVNSFPESRRNLELMRFASEHIQLQHNFYVCRYLYQFDYAWRDWEDITNLKLMEWIKAFLDKHPTESVILDISAEDGDNDDKNKIAAVCQDFFGTLAKYGGYGVFPEIYVDDHAPTIAEAAGKMVIITDMNVDFRVLNDDKEDIGHWGFKSGYSEGDATNKTYALAKTDDYMTTRVYKNNRYDGISKEEKWEYVENGLNDAKSFYDMGRNSCYDPWVIMYTSENRFLKGTPETFAEYINPKVSEYINRRNATRTYQYYGILAMDFVNDPDIVKDISETVWSSNFYRDFSKYGEDYDFSSYALDCNNNAPMTATIIGDGNPWVIVGGLLILAGVITGVVIICKKKCKNNVNKNTEKKQNN